MRTTVDLDPRAPAVARATAAVDTRSRRADISRIILAAVEARQGPALTGFPLFASEPGHVLTDDLVAQHRDEP